MNWKGRRRKQSRFNLGYLSGHLLPVLRKTMKRSARCRCVAEITTQYLKIRYELMQLARHNRINTILSAILKLHQVGIYTGQYAHPTPPNVSTERK
jgi:hypothetical protein